MKIKKEKSTPERLLLGLVVGLAASLCVLEYGEPLAANYKFIGEVGEILDLTEEDIRVTLPEPEETLPEPEKVNKQSTELNIVPDAEIKEETETEIEDLVIIDTGLYIPDFVPEPKIIQTMPFILIEEKPEFEGLEAFLGRNIKYPPRRRDAGDQAQVGVRFTVTHTGEIDKSNIEILGNHHPDFTREVLRVMKLMPDWKPGKQRGKPVNVIHTLPIRFKLKS